MHNVLSEGEGVYNNLKDVDATDAIAGFTPDQLAAQQAVREGRLSMGHARALVGAEDAEGLARTIMARGLSVRETERLVRVAKGGKAARPSMAGAGCCGPPFKP